MVRISLETGKIITDTNVNQVDENLKVSDKKRLFGLNFKAK